MSPKRIALWILIASVGASAILGIVTILTGSFSDLQIRIILTTLTVSAASMCGLACGALWETRRRVALPLSGSILAASAAILLIAGIWSRAESSAFWKLSISVSLLAAATAHSSLLLLAKLAQRFVWSRFAAVIAIYLLAGLLIYLIYYEPRGDTGFRIVGATSIVVAALSLLTPIFHRLSRGNVKAATSNVPQNVPKLFATVSCPQCGVAHPNSLTPIKCGCGCQFVVVILGEEGSWRLTSLR